MPTVERHPHIDPTVKYVGVSKLRDLNAEKLKETTDTFVFQENERPLAVLLTYDKYMAMQEELEAVARTVEMVSERSEVEALLKGRDDVKAGRIRRLEQVDKEIKKRRGQ